MQMEDCSELTQEQVEKIVKSKLNITYIGHSLGGMLLSMYLIFCKMLRRDHYLSKAILLSPAGTHFHANWVIRAAGYTATYAMPYVSTNVHVPDIFMSILIKLLSDIKYVPAAADLCTYIASQLFGGPSYGKQTVLFQSAKILASVVNFGWSNMLAAHMLRVF